MTNRRKSHDELRRDPGITDELSDSVQRAVRITPWRHETLGELVRTSRRGEERAGPRCVPDHGQVATICKHHAGSKVSRGQIFGGDPLCAKRCRVPRKVDVDPLH
jgi:hypothetical protein